MKNGWDTKTLDQISINWDSKRVPITKGVRIGGEYPYYGASGVVDYVADYIFDEETLLVSEDGANLLARASPIAFAASGKYWVNNHAHILKFDNPTTQRLVELYLNSIPLDAYLTGAAQPKLNQKALNSIPIPVPPLAEQERMVRVLDEALDGIATAKANSAKILANARAVFDSYVQSAFNDAAASCGSKRLDDLAGFKNGLNFNQSSKGQSVEIVGVGDFQDNDIVPLSSLSSITIDGELAGGYELREGDLLTVRSNGSKDLVGRCMIVPELSGVLSYSGFIIRIRPDMKLVLPRFLMYFMKSGATRNRLTRDGGGANISNINQGKLSALEVPVPSLSEQRSIVKKLDSIREETQALESIVFRKATALDALKQSLLREAFSGRL